MGNRAGRFALISILLGFWLGAAQASSASDGSREPRPIECDLWEDSQGVTHLRAKSDLGAYVCLGYLHGRDRAWQMDFFRRTIQGRRAEVLGAQEIRTDFLMRLLGLYPKAEATFRDLASFPKAILEAYSHGVNRGFSSAIENGVYEFEKWGYLPEPWKPSDSIAVILLQSFDQTRQAFQTGFEEYQSLVQHGKDAPDLFIRDGMPWDRSILKPGEFPLAKKPQSASLTPATEGHAELWAATRKVFEGLPELISSADVGSNNWVISPALSRSRRAWLANDPHLELKHPPMWHWSHIESPGMDVIGAALPGVPLIVSGTNRQVSWGLTNSYLDVADLTVIPTEDLKGERQPNTERPWIWFKFWKFKIPFFFKSTQRILGNHPLLPLEGPKGKAIALSWSGFDLKAQDFSGFFELMGSKSAAEADRAFSHIGVPSWNFVFADTQGKIGYRSVGRVPRRESPRPFGMREQRYAEFAQRFKSEKMLSTDEMPHLFNPKRGWIATANNRQWPPEAQFAPGRAHRQGFRQFRIEELLTKTKAHDFETLKATQCDVQSVEARFLLPELLKNTPETATTRVALELLKRWDYQAGLDCQACAIYRRWMDWIRSESGYNPPALFRILSSSEHHLGSKLKGVLQTTLGKAIIDIQSPKSTPEVPFFPKWGNIHGAFFVHMGDRDFFPAQRVPTPGDSDSVAPGTAEWKDGFFRHIAGASQRLIVEMSDPPTVYAILPGRNRDSERRDFGEGNSPWKKWAACDFEKRIFPMDWSEVKAAKLMLSGIADARLADE